MLIIRHGILPNAQSESSGEWGRPDGMRKLMTWIVRRNRMAVPGEDLAVVQVPIGVLFQLYLGEALDTDST